MSRQEYNVLLVEDSPGDARLIEMALANSIEVVFHVDHVEWLSSATTAFENRKYDAILLDLSLPDSSGVDTLSTFMQVAPGSTVLVMTANEDMRTAMRCVRLGAQDFILKDTFVPAVLVRSILYAIERRRADRVNRRLMQSSVREFAPVDAVAVQGYVRSVKGAMEETVDYLRKNAPAVADDVVSIFERNNVFVALRGALESTSESLMNKAMQSVPDVDDSGDAQGMLLAAIDGLEKP